MRNSRWLVWSLAALATLTVGCTEREAQPPTTDGDDICAALQVRPGGATASQWEDGRVGLAFALEVEGGATATDVTITSMSVLDGVVEEPPLPLQVGIVVGEQAEVVQAVLTGEGPSNSEQLELNVGGTWVAATKDCEFSLRVGFRPLRYGDGQIETIADEIRKQRVVDVELWPEPREDRPEELEPPELRPIVPPGPPRDLFAAQSPATATDDARLDSGAVRGSAAEFTRLGDLGGSGLGNPPDPAVVADTGGDTVLYAANTLVGWSTDVGATFTAIDLFTGPDPANAGRTTFFPEADGGLCCDQVLAYSARHDLYVWVLQYWPAATGPNRLRLAWATPADATADFANAWTWADVTSAVVGIGDDWMDYPDVVVSDAHVYLSVDHALKGTGSVYTDRRIITRWSLADMADTSKSSVSGGYVDLNGSNLVKDHFLRNSRSDGWWAAPSNTSTLTVYHWPGNSGNISWTPVPISSYSTKDYKSTAPDGDDWNLAPKNVLGGTYASVSASCPDAPCDDLGALGYFAFSAGRDAERGRKEPYVRIEAVDLSTLKLVTEVDIWNPDFAFSTPSLCTSLDCGAKCDVAMAVAVGGGGSYAAHSVGFLYDWLVYTTTSSDTTANRWGDYYTVLPSLGPVTPTGRGQGYSSLGYDVRAATPGGTCATGCRATPRYVQFGRPGVLTSP